MHKLYINRRENKDSRNQNMGCQKKMIYTWKRDLDKLGAMINIALAGSELSSFLLVVGGDQEKNNFEVGGGS
jgi:hypothetical protein